MLNGHVGHGRVAGPAVPVPVAGSHHDDVAGSDLSAAAVGGTDETLAVGDDEDLAVTVDVGPGTSPGLEVDGEDGRAVSEGAGQALEASTALEVLGDLGRR